MNEETIDMKHNGFYADGARNMACEFWLTQSQLICKKKKMTPVGIIIILIFTIGCFYLGLKVRGPANYGLAYVPGVLIACGGVIVGFLIAGLLAAKEDAFTINLADVTDIEIEVIKKVNYLVIQSRKQPPVTVHMGEAMNNTFKKRVADQG